LDGSFPAFRTGANPVFSLSASAEPKMNPAALDADHQVHRLVQMRRGHRLDGQLKAFAILQQRGDVVEQKCRPSENQARAECAASVTSIQLLVSFLLCSIGP
jgi:hypothetical protein